MASGLREHVVRRLPTPLRLAARRVRYGGAGMRCPLCASAIAEYRDFGAGHGVLERRKVVGGMRLSKDVCPVCYGASRARLMTLYLDKALGVGERPLRLLHVAPDIGVYYWLRGGKRLDYVPVDLEPERYSIVPGVRRADLTALPFEDGAFDAVIASHVLEHIPDDRGAMREIRRVLKPGGVGLLMVPEATDGHGTDEDPSIADRRIRVERFGQEDHVRLYSRDDFVARLVECGFEVAAFDGFAEFPEAAKDLDLNPLERLRVVRPAAG